MVPPPPPMPSFRENVPYKTFKRVFLFLNVQQHITLFVQDFGAFPSAMLSRPCAKEVGFLKGTLAKGIAEVLKLQNFLHSFFSHGGLLMPVMPKRHSARVGLIFRGIYVIFENVFYTSCLCGPV